jgi:hypothetical protein
MAIYDTGPEEKARKAATARLDAENAKATAKAERDKKHIRNLAEARERVQRDALNAGEQV